MGTAFSLLMELKIHGDGLPSKNPIQSVVKSPLFQTVMVVPTVQNSTLHHQKVPRNSKRLAKMSLNGSRSFSSQKLTQLKCLSSSEISIESTYFITFILHK